MRAGLERSSAAVMDLDSLGALREQSAAESNAEGDVPDHPGTPRSGSSTATSTSASRSATSAGCASTRRSTGTSSGRRGIWGVALHEDVLHVSKTPELFCSSKSSRPDAPR